MQRNNALRNWGGLRSGAGRKPRSRNSITHAKRPRHSEHHPLHVTLRVVDKLPSLRKKRIFRVVREALLGANQRGKHREHFRLTHFSVQNNHVHLIAEATNEQRLSRGVQGLAVRIARQLNRALGRKGRIFARRYHARALKTPREVRTVLAYVLLNEQRHLFKSCGRCLSPWYFDPCSSALEFDGWLPLHGLDPPEALRREVTVAPQSALLRLLWRHHGLIATYEVPGQSFAGRS